MSPPALYFSDLAGAQGRQRESAAGVCYPAAVLICGARAGDGGGMHQTDKGVAGGGDRPDEAGRGGANVADSPGGAGAASAMDGAGGGGHAPRPVPGTALREILYGAEYGIDPVVDALYCKREPEARERLRLRRAQLADPLTPLDPQSREVLSLYSYWLDWQVTRAFEPTAAWPAKQGELRAVFEQPAVTRLGEVCRHKLLIQLLVNLETPGKLSFAPERFHALLRRVPPEERHSELYYYVAGWAFRHADLPALEEAFEFFTVHADGVASDYNWQYVNLMYQILKGAAGPRDVHELLLRMSLPQEVRQFRLFILPELQRRGVLTPALAAEIEATGQRIAALPPHRPAPEAHTKHIGPDY
jgi:hypothetical protein